MDGYQHSDASVEADSTTAFEGCIEPTKLAHRAGEAVRDLIKHVPQIRIPVKHMGLE